MVNRGLVESLERAQRLVMAGQVRVNGQVALQASLLINPQAEIDLETGSRFVSRGGEKLEAVFQTTDLKAEGKICADVGASTGGFTDCLLQHGATKVYSIDVGWGILDWKLRQDKRVVVMERVNARRLRRLPEPVALITMDVSFISLKALLPVVRGWFDQTGGDVIALVKPQFEAPRELSARSRGVIRDPEIHQKILQDFLVFAESQGFRVQATLPSPLLGPKGNVEFLVWLAFPRENKASSTIGSW